MRVDVQIDAHRADEMLAQLAERTRGRGAMNGPLERAAEQGATMISGIAHLTGELAGSVKAGGRDGPGLIVADADYARFVFGGTRYMAAQPPAVPGDAIASILAEEVAREVFR